MFDPSKETDVPRLQTFGVAAKFHNVRLMQELARQSAELDKLKGQVAGTDLQLRLEGIQKSLNELTRDGSEEPTSVRGRARKGSKSTSAPHTGHGPTDQPDLQQPDLICELDAADQICPKCGDDLNLMLGQYEESELVDVIEVQYVVRQVKRKKYACRCGHIDTALGPDRVAPGGRYSLEFGVQVAVQKFLDHLPWSRQARMMSRRGLNVTSQALWDQMWVLRGHLLPTYLALWSFVKSHRVIGLDQTCWPNLGKKPKKNWQLWCLTSETASVYSIRDTKNTEDFLRLVGDYEGFVSCDDLGTHRAGARASPGITLTGCWAHIIRKFREVEDDFPIAREFSDLIRQLYELDEIAPNRASRRMIRRRLAPAVLDEMYQWLTTTSVLMSTSLGGAIKHTLKIWPRLGRFVGSPDIWLDNNRTERGIRGPVLGRGNYFGCKSKRGTEVAAIVYSLLETAKLSGLNPHDYLLAVARHAVHNPGAALLPADYRAQLDC